MNQRELTQAMDLFAEREKWIVTMAELREFFDDRSAALKVMMHRHVHAGIVVRICPGIFMHARARRQNKANLGALLRCMRPNDAMYVSLDNALLEHGRKAAGDPGTLYLMTSGLSYSYKCDPKLFKALFDVELKAIEFRHTDRPLAQIQSGISGELYGGVPLASLSRAMEDMTRTCRPLPPGDAVQVARGVQQMHPPMVAAA